MLIMIVLYKQLSDDNVYSMLVTIIYISVFVMIVLYDDNIYDNIYYKCVCDDSII